MLAHEFRTPLTVIQGYADRIKSGRVTDPEQIKKNATLIHTEALRLARLVEELLDISHIKSGRQQIERVKTDITSIIEKAAETLKPAAQLKQLVVRLAFSKRPLTISVDPDKIYQLILNLTDNAIKYTPAGGEVEVKSDEIPTMEVQGETFIASFVQLIVKDTGIGIAKSDHEKVFEEFYRAEGARRMKEPGTGLGLSISRGIVQAHGGRIWVESEPGQGSRFTVTLPNYQPIEKLAEIKKTADDSRKPPAS